MFVLNLFSKLSDSLFSGSRDILGFALGKKVEEVNQVSIGKIEIQDSRAAAGALSLGRHADFTDTSTTLQ
jgi:hypothetical protein